MRKIIGFTAAFVYFVIAVASAQGQEGCHTTKIMQETLKKLHNEVPASVQVVNGYEIVIYQSPQGTYTIVKQLPNGTSCLINAGVYNVRDKGI